MAEHPRHLKIVSVDGASIMTYVDEEGPMLVMLPSYDRDGLGDFDHVAAGIPDRG